MVRIFLSIPIEGDVKNKLIEMKQILNAASLPIKYVEDENLHINLKFIGETSSEKIDMLKDCFSKYSQQFSSFSLEIKKMGLFPDPRRPRVIWAGITPEKALFKLQQQIEDDCASIGLEKEKRRYKPHITLGRVKSAKNKDQLLQLANSFENKFFGTLSVNTFHIVKSVLTPSGPQYSSLYETILAPE